MSASVFTPDQLLAEISPQSFDDYATFERTLIEHFDAHLYDFPPGYRWRDVLDWALRRDLIRREADRIVVGPRV